MGLWKKLRQLINPLGDIAPSFDLTCLQRLIDYRFAHPELARLALSHRSLSHARGSEQPSNERLEFLGDSVLGLVIADQLYRDNPHMFEGDLTKAKAMLVNETTLAQVGIDIGLNRLILMSSEEEKSGGRERPSIVSDAVEAVIGAIYLDGGLEATRRMILNCLYSRRHDIINDAAQQNYKGDLLERVQATGNELPHYEVIRESGPDHNKTFCVVVTVSRRLLGEGTGSSKKDAEQKAARVALERLDQSSSE